MVYWKKWAAKHECEELKSAGANPVQTAKEDQPIVDRQAPQGGEGTILVGRM